MANETVGIALCAGLGTRLRALCPSVAKAAFVFAGRPLAAYGLSVMAGAGITTFGINTHFMASTVREALSPALAKLGHEAIFCHEEVLLGTAGGARHVYDALGGERAVIFHGDVLAAADLELALAAHRRCGCRVTLVVAPRLIDDELGNIFVDEAGDIVGIHGHRRADRVGALRELKFCGIHIVERSLLLEVPADKPSCWVHDIYPSLLASGERIGAYMMPGFFSDMGTPERVAHARAILQGSAALRDRLGIAAGALG